MAKAKVSRITQEVPKQEAPKAGKTRKIGASRWKPEQVITLLVDHNPKRVKSEAHKRFELYEDEMSVEDALEAGITTGDLNWDVDHKLIKIADEFDDEAEKRSKAEPKPRAKTVKEEAEVEEEDEEEEAPKPKARRRKAKVADEEEE